MLTLIEGLIKCEDNSEILSSVLMHLVTLTGYFPVREVATVSTSKLLVNILCNKDNSRPMSARNYLLMGDHIMFPEGLRLNRTNINLSILFFNKLTICFGDGVHDVTTFALNSDRCYYPHDDFSIVSYFSDLLFAFNQNSTSPARFGHNKGGDNNVDSTIERGANSFKSLNESTMGTRPAKRSKSKKDKSFMNDVKAKSYSTWVTMDTRPRGTDRDIYDIYVDQVKSEYTS